MKLFSELRRLAWRFREQPRARKTRTRSALSLEALESRELLSTTSNLIVNPGFETPDLIGPNESASLSNLSGWGTFNLQTSPGSNGYFALQKGALSPLSLVSVPAPMDGSAHQAMLDELDFTPIVPGGANPNPASSYDGAHTLYQDVIIPAFTTSATLSFNIYINSAAPLATSPPLDQVFNNSTPNQQVRVDIMNPTADPLSVASGDVLQNIQVDASNSQVDSETVTVSLGASFLNKTTATPIRIRFAAANNRGKLLVGVDNVRLTATFASAAPSVSGLGLRNPSFLSGPATLPQSNDPTITGQVSDPGSVNNVSFVDFDVNNNVDVNGNPVFGGPGDVKVTTFDANGFFDAALPRTLLAGVHTIPVQVVNAQGLSSTTTFTFIMQGTSLATWEPQGPDPISVKSLGLDYPTVTGNVTGVVSDPADPSGNTLYLASDGGGVWKTVDGGNDWVAQTDNQFDPNGQRIPEGIGAITVGRAQIGGNPTSVVYAATGVANTFFPTGGDGILRSLDGGVSWTDVGQSVFKGAHISAIVTDPNLAIDPNNPTTGNGLNFLPVFVAVSWFDDPTKQPGVFASFDGGTTWKNILTPATMQVPGGGTLAGMGVTQIASVTSLVVDPRSTRGNVQLVAGVGYIGETNLNATKLSTGVWYLAPGSNNTPAWTLEVGGKGDPLLGPIPNSGLPAGLDANGDILGSVKVAVSSGQLSNQPVFYVTIATPPPFGTGATPGGFDGGHVTASSVRNATADISGLYKTKDNFNNFTKVQLNEFVGFVPNKNNVPNPLYVPIGLDGNYANNAGALLADPSDPNVVYIGGSQLIGAGGHGLIRVDTGDMRDTTYIDRVDGVGDIPNDGDDIVKSAIAEEQWRADNNGAADPNHLGDYAKVNNTVVFYNDNGADGNRFFGEGVYWYDLTQAGVNGSTGTTLLPTTINSLARDGQGRLLIGTFNGVWRGTEQGFSYDYTSGIGSAIPDAAITTDLPGLYAAFTGSAVAPATPTPPGMLIQDLNGNLQITDLTSVAIDPTAASTYYTTELDNGTAKTATALPNSWTTMGMTGPTVQSGTNLAFLPTPNGARIIASGPAPDGTPGVLYRDWQFLSGTAGLGVQVSRDGGKTWGPVIVQQGINDTGAAISPAFALNPTKQASSSNGVIVYNDQLLFGGKQVWLSDSSGNQWSPITNGALDPNPNGAISALAIAPMGTDIFYAGTTDGLFFAFQGGVNWANRSPVLPAGARINNITVDPNAPNTVYIMVTTQAGGGVWKTTNAGQTWTQLSTGLPNVPAYALVVDPRPAPGAAQGFLYVGTQTGVFISTDSGAHWGAYGLGLPSAPVVDLQLNPKLNELTAAVQGRGVFELSTDRIGPQVVATTPATPTQGPLTNINVTFNKPINPTSFNLTADGIARSTVANQLVGAPEYLQNRVAGLYRQFLRRAPSSNEAAQFINQMLQPFGELSVISILVGSQEYYDDAVGQPFTNQPHTPANNNLWLTRAYQDLFGPTFGPGTPGYSSDLAALNSGASPQQLAFQLVQRPQALANIAATIFNQLQGTAKPVGTAALLSDPALSFWINTFAQGTSPSTLVAAIVGSQSFYNTDTLARDLPAGATPTAVALADLSGATDVYGDPILDLVVADSANNVVYVYQGQPGGGYLARPTLTLALPAGASPSALVVTDLNGDGKPDIAVANGGLTGGSNQSVSVFINATTAGGPITLGSRFDYNGGNHPTGIVAADVNGDNKTDLAVSDGAADATNHYDVSVLLGTNAANAPFVVTPTVIPVGSTAPGSGDVTAPTGLALGDLNGDNKPDLAVSGTNGLAVLINTSTAGTVAFAPLANRMSNTATTSVAIGKIDTGTTNDIAATTDVAGGEVLVFQNDGAATPTLTLGATLAAGASPRDVTLRDLNGDGLNDIVVANDVAVGTATVFLNKTTHAASGPDTVAFAAPVTYMLNGGASSAVAVGDVNQDGTLDIVGANGSGNVMTLSALRPALFLTPNDGAFLNTAFLKLLGRAATNSELSMFVNQLTASETVYLSTPFGPAEPLAIAPTDATNTTFTLTFGSQTLDGTYTLVVGPSNLTVSNPNLDIRDEVDLNGTFVNIGNQMDQNGNPVNGEFPADRFSGQFVINTSDDGAFVSGLYHDLLGRSPDTNGFLGFIGAVDTARQQALAATMPAFTISTAYRSNIVTQLYQSLLGRAPSGPATTPFTELNFWLFGSNGQGGLAGGQWSERVIEEFIIGSQEYYDRTVTIGSGVPTSGAQHNHTNNVFFITQLYKDVLGRTAGASEVALWVNILDNGTLTQQQVVNALVFSNEGLAFDVRQLYLHYVGRTPNAGETAAEVNLLLQNYNPNTGGQPFTPGTPDPSEQAVDILLAAPEYLQHVGNTNTAWANSLYTNLPNSAQAPLPFTASGVRDQLLLDYVGARQNAAGAIAGSVEHATQLVTSYYRTYLPNINGGTGPTAAQVAAEVSKFPRDEQRLADLLSSADYAQLNLNNDTYLRQVYHDLGLSPSDIGGTAYNAYLNYLNQNAATEQQARFTVLFTGIPALNGNPAEPGLLTTDEYRRILIAGWFKQYFGGATVSPNSPEVTAVLQKLQQGQTQEQALAFLLSDALLTQYSQGETTYFLLPHPLP